MQFLTFLILNLFLSYHIVKTENQTTSPGTVKIKNDILIQSTDAGKTWQSLGAGLPGNQELRAIHVFEGSLYVGTNTGKIYHSENPASGKWEVVNFATFPEMAGLVPNHKIVSGLFSGNQNIYAVIHEIGFYRKVQDADRWEPMHLQVPDLSIRTVMETPDGGLLLSTLSGIYKSMNAGQTWKHVYNKSYVHEIESSKGIMIANCKQGIIRSHDNGETWSIALEDPGAYYRTKVMDDQFLILRSNGKWRSLEDDIPNRAYVSYDTGISWHILQDLWSKDKEIYDLESTPDFQFSSRKNGIYRSGDNGKTWEINHSIPQRDAPVRYDLESNKNTIYALMQMSGC